MCANEDFNITYYPDQGYCEFYWECIDGNLTTQHQCTESGHVFNMAAQQCSYMNDLINCDNPCNYDQDSSTSSTDVPKTSTSSAPTGSTTSTTPGPDTTSKPEGRPNAHHLTPRQTLDIHRMLVQCWASVAKYI